MKQVIPLSNDQTALYFLFQNNADREAVVQIFKEISVSVADPASSKKIILDFDGMTYIDSHFIGKLFEITEELKAKGGALVTVVKANNIMDVLKTVGAETIFSIATSLEEAKEKLLAP